MQLSTEISSPLTPYAFSKGAEEEFHILVASRDKRSLEELQYLVSEQFNCKVSSNLMLNGQTNPLQGCNTNPDLIVFKVSDKWRTELADLPDSLGGLKIEKVIVSDNDEQECMRMAIQAGAKDFICPPLTSNDLIESIRRVRSEMGSIKQRGKLVSIINAKGGAGASFIASNVAYIMSAVSKMNVVLLDLDLQFGTLCHYLNLEPQRGLIDAIQNINELDEVALHAYLLKHKSGLKILESNPHGVTLSEDVPEKKLNILLDLLLSCHDEVVADLPRQIDLLTSTVLEKSEKILVVVQQEIASIRDATRLISIFRKDLGIQREKIQVIVNRYNKNASIEIKDIEKALKVDSIYKIPNDFKNAHECIDAGIPLYEYDKNATSTRAFMALESSVGGRSLRTGTGLINRVTSYFKRT